MAVKAAKGVRKKPAKPAAGGRRLRIRLVRSLIAYPDNQHAVARGLGLRKVGSEVIRPETPEIMGMVRKISHVLKVEPVEEP
ncbi:MAG: 50S ribosomal protein L30 [Candidatus Aminicenantes bacterium]|nr:50S ribosomal protein L30 [Candidatus Aminicenantes bacterium]